MKLITLIRMRREAQRLMGQYLQLKRNGKALRAFATACFYNAAAHRYNHTKPKWVKPMAEINLEVQP